VPRANFIHILQVSAIQLQVATGSRTFDPVYKHYSFSRSPPALLAPTLSATGRRVSIQYTLSHTSLSKRCRGSSKPRSRAALWRRSNFAVPSSWTGFALCVSRFALVRQCVGAAALVFPEDRLSGCQGEPQECRRTYIAVQDSNRNGGQEVQQQIQ
jgi:hypothetical protein